MNTLVWGLVNGYRWLQQLLPREFSQDFSVEMQFVFRQVLLAASRRGPFRLALTGMRELAGLFLLILTEQGSSLSAFLRRTAAGNEGNILMEQQKSSPSWVFSSKGRAWLAALPPVIFGAGGVLAILAARTGNLILVVAVWVFISAIIGVGGLAALVKRLPDWGWTWCGSALMLVAVALKILAEELAEVSHFIISPFGDLALMGAILLVGFILLLTAARHGWQPGGLVSLGFAAIFGLTTLSLVSSAPFNRADLVLLMLPGGILFGLLIWFYIKASDTARVLFLVGAWLLNAGMFYLVHWVWMPWQSVRGGPSLLIPLLVFSTGFLLSGPVIGLLRRPFMRLWGRV
jgi:hypothetical protein